MHTGTYGVSHIICLPKPGWHREEKKNTKKHLLNICRFQNKTAANAEQHRQNSMINNI